MDYSGITAIHLDVLKEICNIGAGNAATSLSQILNQKVDMRVPNASVVDFNDLLRIFGHEEEVVLGVMILYSGDISGSMIFMLPKHSIGRMIGSLLGRTYTEDTEFDEMDMSAMKEIGNIIVGSYVSSMASMTGFSIRVSEPFAAIDMAASILSVPVSEVGRYGDNVLFMESYILCDGVELGGHFIMLPSIDSYEKIMSVFGM